MRVEDEMEKKRDCSHSFGLLMETLSIKHNSVFLREWKWFLEKYGLLRVLTSKLALNFLPLLLGN
eukprot:m.12166 g.12166  ORF g.12166 m.12166 type:complete len:65 (-) comp7130_c0_seq1:342-536(-)